MSELSERFNASFKRLSEEQQETITYLIEGILDGSVNEVNVATRESARIGLARFEGAAERLSADECAAELARYEINVAFDMTPATPGDSYIVSERFTLKGLRHVLAREKFMEAITCNVTDELSDPEVA